MIKYKLLDVYYNLYLAKSNRDSNEFYSQNDQIILQVDALKIFLNMY